jgi:cytochrome P450
MTRALQLWLTQNLAFMHRVATTDVYLADNVFIRKGSKIAISSHRMWSSQVYKCPNEFDAYRFIRLQGEANWATKSMLVATSKDHTAWGHGKHGCPGRFFAAMEVKVALIHLLTKYDMKLENPGTAAPKVKGFSMLVNPDARIKVQRRDEKFASI